MKNLSQLLSNNRSWAREMCRRDPAYFQRLAAQQAPDYLWIGCSDSRVPANTILGLEPGEVFVHRNEANLVKPKDINCLSVMQFAIDTIKVRHIIVCGHYGCGGVRAAMCEHLLDLSQNWLGDIQAITQHHEPLLAHEKSEASRLALLCELNVIEQVMNVCKTEIVRGAWLRGRELTVHGWIYGLADGLLRDLDISVSAPDELTASYRDTLASISRKNNLLHH